MPVPELTKEDFACPPFYEKKFAINKKKKIVIAMMQ